MRMVPAAQRESYASVAAGAIVVDNSSAFRMDPEVPLVIQSSIRLPVFAPS